MLTSVIFSFILFFFVIENLCRLYRTTIVSTHVAQPTERHANQHLLRFLKELSRKFLRDLEKTFKKLLYL